MVKRWREGKGGPEGRGQPIREHDLPGLTRGRWELCLLHMFFVNVSVKVSKGKTAGGSGTDKCSVVALCTEPIPF